MNFTLWQDGQEYGPYDLDSVEASIESGDLSPQTLARIEEGSDWKPLETLLSELKQPKTNKPFRRRAPSSEISQELVKLAYGSEGQQKSVAEPKNPAARKLSYILFALTLPFIAWAVLKNTPTFLEDIHTKETDRHTQFANEMEALGGVAEHSARLQGASLRQARESGYEAYASAEKGRAEAERSKRLADELRDERQRMQTIFWGVSGILALAGVILRVYS